ncbi:MAG: hypothetical protein JWP37_3065 [Mucilaginibacter sp.]|nr:hypothetical protein [Mucilaginibacter sp.]
MIAYNKTWLANLRLHEALEKGLKSGCIIDAEFKIIKEKYPVGFYTPTLFARVGLFILTCIVMLFIYGLIALMVSSSSMFSNPAFPFFLGLISYAGLEFMVNGNNHYRSGVDDALLFISGCLFLAGLMMMFTGNNDTHYIGLTAIAFLISLFLTIRFADMFMSAACCIFFFSWVFFFWTKVTPSGTATVPFVMMLVSAGGYWLLYTLRNKLQFINYQNCFIVGLIICLVTLYAAGNYYIIQTLGDELNGTNGKAVPFGAIFWAWTIILPFVYVGFGIKRKDAILLRTGLLLIAAAALTFRNYYHILPIDTSLTVVGAAILGIAYSVMKYLETPKHGFTYAEPDESHLMDHLKVESLIIAETFSTAPSAPTDNGVKFGGGDFGGGGSSDTF